MSPSGPQPLLFETGACGGTSGVSCGFCFCCSARKCLTGCVFACFPPSERGNRNLLAWVIRSAIDGLWIRFKSPLRIRSFTPPSPSVFILLISLPLFSPPPSPREFVRPFFSFLGLLLFFQVENFGEPIRRAVLRVREPFPSNGFSQLMQSKSRAPTELA